jgi:hypothetical protein
MNMTGGPSTLTTHFSIVAIGSRVLMYGGLSSPKIVYTFDSTANAWIDSGIADSAPTTRYGDYQAIAVGSRMFIWGGNPSSGYYWGDPAGLFEP